MTDDTATPAAAAAAEPETTGVEQPHAAAEVVAALPGPEEHAALPEHVEHAEGEVAAETLTEAGVPAIAEEASAAPAEEAAPPAVADEESESAAEEADEPAVDEAPVAAAPAVEAPLESKKKWYVVKVQSAREESIKAAIERKVKIEGFEEFYGQIAIPVEEVVEKKKVRVKVKDKKTGESETVTQEKNVVKHRKKFPGYLFAEVEFNPDILTLFRETSGVGDFVGASQHRAPNPMTESEVRQMLTGILEKGSGKDPRKVKVKLEFEKGDKVRIRDGPFANMEGEVKAITEAKDATETPKVTVEVTIFGRGVPVDLDYWHVDKV